MHSKGWGVGRLAAATAAAALVLTGLTGAASAPVAARSTATAPATTGLPAPVKQTHPYIYVDAAKVKAFRAALPDPTFPSAGSLQLTVTSAFADPRSTWETGQDVGLFDQHGSRDHLFIRHVRSYDRPHATPPMVGYQIGLQTRSGAYAAQAAPVMLPAGKPAVLKVSWDADRQTASYSVSSDGGTTRSMTWQRVNGQPVAWRPTDQEFAFRGRHGDRVTNVTLSDARGPSTTWPSIDLYTQRAWWRLKELADRDTATLLSCANPADPAATCGRPVVLTGGSAEHPHQIQEVVHWVGLAHLVTGEQRYRTALLNYASQLMAVTPANHGGEYPMRGRLAAMGLIYDWLHAAVSSTQAPTKPAGTTYAQALRQRIVETITADTGGVHDIGLHICGQQPVTANPLDCASKPQVTGTDTTKGIGPFYLGGHAEGNVLAIAIALAAIANERPDVKTGMLATAYLHHAEGFVPAYRWVGADGGHQMGSFYGGARAANIESAELWSTVLAWSSPPPPESHALTRSSYYLYAMRGTTPATFLRPGDGGYAVSNPDNPAAPPLNWDNQVTAALLYASARRTAATASDGAVAQWLYERYAAPERAGGHFWDLLLRKPGATATAPDALPTSRHFSVGGHVLMRDTWNFPAATLMSLSAPSFVSENHHHRDANSVTLDYRGPLLVDSGYYDSYGSTHWRDYYTRSIAHNTLVMYDPADAPAFGNAANDGGQGFFDGKRLYPTLAQAQPGGVNALAGVVRYEHRGAGTGDFTYTAGDASRAYPSTKIASQHGFVRNVLYLRSSAVDAKPIAVVYDSVRTLPAKSALDKTMLWHSAAEPAINGDVGRPPGVWPVASSSRNVARISNGSGVAYLQTLLPASPRICKVGGADATGAGYRFATPVGALDCRREHYSDRRPAASEARLRAVPDLGAWRLEITDTAKQPGTKFLHVINVADEGTASAPVTSRPVASDAGTQAVLLGDATVAVFAEYGVQRSEHSLWIREPLGKRFIVSGLTPGASYAMTTPAVNSSGETQVRFIPATDGAYRASAQGIVTVDPPPPATTAPAPADVPVPPPASAPTPAAEADPVVGRLPKPKDVALLRRGRLGIVVSCPGSAVAGCAGRIRVDMARGGRPLAKGRAYSLAVGERRRLRVTLSKKGVARLTRGTVVKVRVTLSAPGSGDVLAKRVIKVRRGSR